jgi:hypothetical protein
MPILLVVTRRIQVKVPVVVPRPAQISRTFGLFNRRGELLSTASFGVRLGLVDRPYVVIAFRPQPATRITARFTPRFVFRSWTIAAI